MLHNLGKREQEGSVPNEEPLHRNESMEGGLREHGVLGQHLSSHNFKEE